MVARGLVGDNMYLIDPWYGPTINTYSWVCRGSSEGSMHTWTHTLTMNTSPQLITSIITLLLLQ